MDRWRPTAEQAKAVRLAPWIAKLRPDQHEDARQEAWIRVWLAQDVDPGLVAKRAALDWMDTERSQRLSGRLSYREIDVADDSTYADLECRDTPDAWLELRQTVEGFSEWQREAVRRALAG
jgi:DNA-directed RNA polymerase specialized sigma24 family protein